MTPVTSMTGVTNMPTTSGARRMTSAEARRAWAASRPSEFSRVVVLARGRPRLATLLCAGIACATVAGLVPKTILQSRDIAVHGALGGGSISDPSGERNMMFTNSRSLGAVASIAALSAATVACSLHAQNAAQWRVEDGGNGHWYEVDTNPAGDVHWTFDEAQEFAQSRGAHLATFSNLQENSSVYSLLSIGSQSFAGWFGLVQMPGSTEPGGGWGWVTGEPLTFSNWQSGEPSNAGCYQPSAPQNWGILEGNQPGGNQQGRWDDEGNPVPACQSAVRRAVIEWSADCNADGIVDYGQILSGQLIDTNSNGIPDICEELHVPADYPTIQGAIDAAIDGNIIRLGAGEFVEACSIIGKSITVRGSGVSTTTWRAPIGGKCLEIADGSTIGFELTDIRFVGGNLAINGSAVDAEGSGRKVVARCDFVGNGGLAALEVFGNNSIIEYCNFTENNLGLSAAVATNLTVRHCRFTDNAQAGTKGGGPWVPADIDFYLGTFLLEDSIFIGSFSQGGASIRVVAQAEARRCAFFGPVGGTAGVAQIYYAPTSWLKTLDCYVCGASTPTFSGNLLDLGGNTIDAQCTDCDADGQADRLQILLGASDKNGNLILDSCEGDPCPGDISGNGGVDGVDLTVLLGSWGTDGTGGEFFADINNDGIVNGADLAVVLTGWGPCAP